jgi:hypothetical protein
MQVCLSKGLEASRRIAATAHVRGWVPSGALVDATVSGTGLGDESVLTELEESFQGDEGKGD